MPTSPRDIDAYLTAMTQSLQRINPNVDVTKGPLSVLFYAMAIEGSRTENLAAYLQQIYQLSDPSQIREDDLFQLALNFGKDPNVAKLAQGTVYFFRSTRPEAGQTYVAQVGTVVSTSDGRYNYIVTEGNEMNGDIADVYFNTSASRYEIPVVVEATAAGIDYNLPPNTIKTIQTFQDDFDGCVNTDYMRNGDDPPDAFQVRDILWNSMMGLNSDIVGHTNAILSTVSPTGIDSFNIVSSADFFNFERLTSVSGKFGYDVYLITDNVMSRIERGTADGGETFLTFERKPVLSVQYVAVDGVSVPFSLDVDTAVAFRGSPKSNDRVTVATALQPGQTWEVSYQYYNTVYEAHEVLQGRMRLFDSDVLVRLANPVDIYVAGETRVFSTADSSSVINDIRTFTEGYLRSPDNPSTSTRTFVTVLDPYEYQRAVEASVDGVQQFRLTRFARLDVATLPIERISLNGRNEYPSLAVNFDVT